MSWSYSGNPASSPKDSLRFVVGDTDTNYPLLSDEEINYTLTKYASENRAAVACCEAIIAKLAQDCDNKLGPAEVKASQRREAYESLLKTFRRKSGMNVAAGLSKIQTHDASFSIDMMSNG